MGLFTTKTAKKASAKAKAKRKREPKSETVIVSKDGQILQGAKVLRVLK